MWQKKESKLELAASMIRQVMPEFQEKIGCREIQAYVTATEKEHGTKRLFFSTIFPEDLQIFCAWQEKEPLNQKWKARK